MPRQATAASERTDVDARTRSTLLDTDQAAEYVRLQPSTLATWRYLGTRGPAFLKLGGRVFYRVRDLEAWLDQNTRTSTSEEQ